MHFHIFMLYVEQKEENCNRFIQHLCHGRTKNIGFWKSVRLYQSHLTSYVLNKDT